MFKKISALWLLLAAALAIVLVVAFSDDISIGSYTVKKAPVADMLLKPTPEMEKHDSLMRDSIRKEQEKIVVRTDSTPQSLFIFGDSMTLNLALRLAQYARQNGHTIHAVNWDSSSTVTWAANDSLKNMIARYKPTHIFITLGSNELLLQDPSLRMPKVKKILETIGDIPYTWIGPPNWKEDTGFNDMLQNTCKPGMFFLTNGMQLDRKKDHIHPTREASAMWVDSIMRWLPKSAHPFLADVPSDSVVKSKPSPNIVFLKALNK